MRAACWNLKHSQVSLELESGWFWRHLCFPLSSPPAPADPGPVGRKGSMAKVICHGSFQGGTNCFKQIHLHCTLLQACPNQKDTKVALFWGFLAGNIQTFHVSCAEPKQSQQRRPAGVQVFKQCSQHTQTCMEPSTSVEKCSSAASQQKSHHSDFRNEHLHSGLTFLGIWGTSTSGNSFVLFFSSWFKE